MEGKLLILMKLSEHNLYFLQDIAFGGVEVRPEKISIIIILTSL